jgi:putative GTP pyrophosphokinase
MGWGGTGGVRGVVFEDCSKIDIQLSLLQSHTMQYREPPSNKSSVRRAGEAIARGTANENDFALVDQWRSSHGYVINTFQAYLRNHISSQNVDVVFAQRLKRRNTVIDKLTRRDSSGNSLINDVVAMHDFAGCRMIFENIEELRTFRSYMHSSAVTKNVKHQLRHEPLKYDYIERPRPSGYRGIHDVYRHFPRGSERSEPKKAWDGLLVEIQYRTRVQHAWATAVEISDLLDGERTKFEMDASERGQFFAVASELIARRHEGMTRAFLDRETNDLQSDLQALEGDLGILRRLELLKQFEDEEKLQRHNVLNIYKSTDGTLGLEVLPFRTAAQAIQKASELESDPVSVNAVYVRSDNPSQLRSAYRNYFYDPIDFVRILRQGV